MDAREKRAIASVRERMAEIDERHEAEDAEELERDRRRWESEQQAMMRSPHDFTEASVLGADVLDAERAVAERLEENEEDRSLDVDEADDDDDGNRRRLSPTQLAEKNVRREMKRRGLLDEASDEQEVFDSLPGGHEETPGQPARGVEVVRRANAVIKAADAELREAVEAQEEGLDEDEDDEE